MTSSKSTKRALISSTLAILMCVAMLIGTTFAWFTDTASTAVNKIQTGNLDMEVEYTLDGENWNDLDGATDIFQKGLWEPGHSEVVGLKIHNAGNLALKYSISMNIANETKGINKAGDEFALSDYLKVKTSTSGGTIGAGLVAAAFGSRNMSKTWQEVDFKAVNAIAVDVPQPVVSATYPDQYYVIKVYMPEEVGNEANAISVDKTPSIEFGINVVATQDTVERDSFGSDYDKDATYPVVDAADLAASVADLATAGNKNVVVSVAQNMDNTAGIKTAKGNTLTMDLNGKTLGVSTGTGSPNTTTNGMQLLQGSTVTLKNGTYKANQGGDLNHNIAILIQNYSNLTIEDCTLDMRDANDSAGNSARTTYALSTNCGKVVIKGDTNITARTDNNGNKEYALDVMHWENTGYEAEGTSVTFDETMTGIVDGKIDVYCYSDSGVVKPVVDGGATLTIMGGTFVNSGLTLEQFKAFVPAGYTVTTNADGSFTVSK